MASTNPLRSLRRLLGLSQLGAATLAGTTQANYCRWETALDDASNPLAPRALECLPRLRRVGVRRLGEAWRDLWATPYQTDDQQQAKQTERTRRENPQP